MSFLMLCHDLCQSLLIMNLWLCQTSLGIWSSSHRRCSPQHKPCSCFTWINHDLGMLLSNKILIGNTFHFSHFMLKHSCRHLIDFCSRQSFLILRIISLLDQHTQTLCSIKILFRLCSPRTFQKHHTYTLWYVVNSTNPVLCSCKNNELNSFAPEPCPWSSSCKISTRTF